MKESNISRDHIALEAMKNMLSKTIAVKATPWGRIKQFFAGTNEH